MVVSNLASMEYLQTYSQNSDSDMTLKLQIISIVGSKVEHRERNLCWLKACNFVLVNVM